MTISFLLAILLLAFCLRLQISQRTELITRHEVVGTGLKVTCKVVEIATLYRPTKKWLAPMDLTKYKLYKFLNKVFLLNFSVILIDLTN